MLIAVRITLRLLIPLLGYAIILSGFGGLDQASKVFSQSRSQYRAEVYFGMSALITGSGLIALAMYAPLSWF